ncbi:MAG: hypothetical protein K0R63_966 [Rickettsiales bacterium]|jgi:hypothetical protein|nr:hypothetical protein [Rickettsiales bacterium]
MPNTLPPSASESAFAYFKRYMEEQGGEVESLCNDLDQALTLSLDIVSLQEELRALGVRDEDFTKIKHSDSQEIKERKKKLKKYFQMLVAIHKKLERQEERSTEGQQKKLIKSTMDKIKQFMDFDHNRDHDKILNSLGETGKNVSAFEKPIAEAAAMLVIKSAAVKLMRQALENIKAEVAKFRDHALAQIREQGMNLAAKYVSLQTGIDVMVVKAGMQLGAKISESQEAERSGKKASAAEQQEASAAMMTAVKSASAPDHTPWAQALNKGKGEPEMGR